MVGSACHRFLQNRGWTHIITASHDELDLCNAGETFAFLQNQKPAIVINAAARVGGIHANQSYPAEFLQSNLAIGLNLVEGSRRAGVKRLLNLGSTCIYPREAPQPIPEEALLTGPLESTNEGYAIAKIATLKLCQTYRQQYGLLYHSAMPTNLYGPGDNYHPENSHVLPALLRRFHEAAQKESPAVKVWGTGKAQREFLHVDDLAAAVFHLLHLEDPPDWVNIGTGKDCTIAELAKLIAATVGYSGKIEFDPSRPDGTPRKVCDIQKIKATGWSPKISLVDGLLQTYQNFRQSLQTNSLRK